MKTNQVDPPHRLSLSFPETVHKDLLDLARARRSTLIEVVRIALGLAKLVIREVGVGNKLIITNKSGKPIKEVVIPD